MQNRQSGSIDFVCSATLMLAAAAVVLSGIPAIACDRHSLLPQRLHTHGNGFLGIAVEGNRLSMEFEAPGADIVGFERKARTPEQKAAVVKAKATLADALSIFQLSADAECKVTDARVTSWVDDGYGAAEADYHSNFFAADTLDCAAPEKLTSNVRYFNGSKYFDAFSGAEALYITWLIEKSKIRYGVSRTWPTHTPDHIEEPDGCE
jgi:hypothetical protein